MVLQYYFKDWQDHAKFNHILVKVFSSKLMNLLAIRLLTQQQNKK